MAARASGTAFENENVAATPTVVSAETVDSANASEQTATPAEPEKT